MQIGYTPDQLSALEEVRAELARLDRRAMNRRLFVSVIAGFAVGGGVGFGLLGKTLEIPEKVVPRPGRKVEPEIVEVPITDPDVLWAIDLAKTGTDEELAANFPSYIVFQTRLPENPDLWGGIERLARYVLDKNRSASLSPKNRRLTTTSLLSVISLNEAQASQEALEFVPELRRSLR